MSNGFKSVVVAAAILFVYFAVLGGEIPPRDGWGIGPRRRITFCNSWVADAPLLDLLPCFALNLAIIVGTFLMIFAVFALVRVAQGYADR